MSKIAEEKLSTTAMAKLLDMSAQQLFSALKDYGWIDRVDNAWILTSKGEFEGGEYRDSKRYGRYIVWPEALQHHALVVSIENSQRLTTANLAKRFGLHPRMVSRALAELGLQTHTILGWELTEQGDKFGGVQEESESSGSLHVSWPKDIIENPVVHRELDTLCLVDVTDESNPDDSVVDLFSASSESLFASSDGHQLHTQLELHVCNWLYLAQLAHAYKRRLPVEDQLLADFYLPAASVYIECWQDKLEHKNLSNKLKKQETYRVERLRVIDIHSRDINRLDKVLGDSLRELGIRC